MKKAYLKHAPEQIKEASTRVGMGRGVGTWKSVEQDYTPTGNSVLSSEGQRQGSVGMNCINHKQIFFEFLNHEMRNQVWLLKSILDGGKDHLFSFSQKYDPWLAGWLVNSAVSGLILILNPNAWDSGFSWPG